VAAFAAGADSSGDRIALVAETDPRRFGAPGAAPAVIAGIRCAVAEFHGVQLHAVLLVGPGAVSKTTSGKLQRFACRAAFIAGTFRALAEWRDGVVSAECL
jgi:acyl-CoA synthetase (AMP-forming)/AMP-acid ligase II